MKLNHRIKGEVVIEASGRDEFLFRTLDFLHRKEALLKNEDLVKIEAAVHEGNNDLAIEEVEFLANAIAPKGCFFSEIAPGKYGYRGN